MTNAEFRGHVLFLIIIMALFSPIAYCAHQEHVDCEKRRCPEESQQTKMMDGHCLCVTVPKEIGR